jgi:GH24 family phage-related lysozyme (muramidase)
LEEYTSTISKILEFEEGFRAAPYVGKLGYLHIGYGTKLSMSKGLSVEDFPITIDREQAKAWLKKDIAKVEASLLRSKSYSKVYKSLSHDRQVVLVSMGYQLGISALFQFKRMWSALGKGDFRLAAHEARDSRWYMQTKNRALRHSRVLEYDNLSGNYSGTL